MTFSEGILLIVALTVASAFAFWFTDQFPDEHDQDIDYEEIDKERKKYWENRA